MVPDAINPREVYAAIGEETFHQLTAKFYEGVAADELLRPLYPGDDLEPARRHLALFLMQYFGGPTTYTDERGHPRLRMRHMPFPIDRAARDAWMTHMRAALDSLALEPPIHATMLRYFEDAATFLMNRGGEEPRWRSDNRLPIS